ncbi:transcription factor IIIB 90 kDa subunit [Acrasis kona]|uniref:Transcription factor IIIB 90 kDa subunit n=1 Tax=Acrasis kona TaxID=1008807 RepID=A0AAW2ZAS4_9EUKA
MSSCFVCGNSNVQYDVDVRGYVCQNCGTVIDDSVISEDLEFNRDSRCPNGMIVDQMTGERGGLLLSRPGSSAPIYPRHFSIIQDTNHQRDRRALAANRKLDENVRIMVHSLQLPSHLYTSIRGMTIQAVGPQDITKLKKVNTTIAVCTYIVCRQNNHPVQLMDVADFISMDVFKLGAQYKKVCSKINIKLDVQDPAILSEKVITVLESELKLTDPIEKMTLMKKVTRLIHVACREWLNTGRKPISMVAAAVKIVVSSRNINLNIEHMANKIGTGSLSIRDRHREMMNMIIKLASPLPWSKDINKRTLPRYLPFILEYIESLRELHRAPCQFQKEDLRLSDEDEDLLLQMPSTPMSETSTYTPSPMSSQLYSTPTDCALTASDEVVTTPTSQPTNLPIQKTTEPHPGPIYVSRKRTTRGSQQKDVQMVMSVIKDVVPPSYVRSQLDRQSRQNKIQRAKRRILNMTACDVTVSDADVVLDEQDRAIEKLLLAGIDEHAIEDGYYHVPIEIQNKESLDKEYLDEQDMDDEELQQYTKTNAQVELELRAELGDDIDGEISRKRVLKKQRFN